MMKRVGMRIWLVTLELVFDTNSEHIGIDLGYGYTNPYRKVTNYAR